MKIEFDIKGQPFGKQNMRPIRIGGHGSLCNTKPNIEYMGLIIDTLNRKYGQDVDVPIFSRDTALLVTITAYFKLPSICYGKKGINQKGLDRLNGKVLPTIRPDCDNISKIVCDAITKSGLVWSDDSQIVGEIITKQYAEIPFVHVVIEDAIK